MNEWRLPRDEIEVARALRRIVTRAYRVVVRAAEHIDDLSGYIRFTQDEREVTHTSYKLQGLKEDLDLARSELEHLVEQTAPIEDRENSGVPVLVAFTDEQLSILDDMASRLDISRSEATRRSIVTQSFLDNHIGRGAKIYLQSRGRRRFRVFLPEIERETL